jgi:hypothetical protein
MPYSPAKDLITQAELRKGAELMIGTSAAVRLIRELYLDALKHRIAVGALVEPGPLGFAAPLGVVSKRKEPAGEVLVPAGGEFSRCG